MNEQHPWYGLLYNEGIKICVIGVLAILALYLGAETMSVAGNLGRPGVPATDTITVQGEGRSTMPPDVAHISFSAQNTAKTVAEAQAMTTKQANDAIEYVKSQGIAEKDIRTLSYTISPQYSYRGCPAGAICPSAGTISGYQVAETVQVTVRDLDKAGDLLAGLGSREVQNVSGPDFALEDSSAGYDAARADAISKAKNQAAVLASQLGVHLGKIVNFSESSSDYPIPLGYGLGGVSEKSVMAAAPTVPTGENTYNASVSITYEIR
jgi:uncharacterized protein YggE